MGKPVNKKASRVKTSRKTKSSDGDRVVKRKAHDTKPIPARSVGPIRKKLLEMREDLIRTVRNQKVAEAEGDQGDAADQASLSTEKELLFELSDNERATLDQVEASLRKIDKGSYGVCESCQKPIAKMRLDALPFARYCMPCQSSSEHAPVGEPEGRGDD